MIRFGIVGTRILDCEGDRTRAELRISQAIMKLWPDIIISGGAEGVDEIAELCAGKFGYTEENRKLRIFRPTVRRFHGPGGFRARDKEIAHASTHVLRLACKKAKTYGSGWTADEAERIGRVVVRELVCP